MKVKVGKLVTLNLDEYPGLGAYWVQLRSAENTDLVVARVYGDNPQEARDRAESFAACINTIQEENEE